MLSGLPYLDQIDGKSLSGLDDKNVNNFLNLYSVKLKYRSHEIHDQLCGSFL
jgi:hypothetical protein